MRDQLINAVNGLIVPISAEKIAGGILQLMESPEMGIQFHTMLTKERFDSQEYLKEYKQTVFCEEFNEGTD